jgi:hypothetical protein
VTKTHYRVTLEDGRELAIFRSIKTGGWSESEPPSYSILGR